MTNNENFDIENLLNSSEVRSSLKRPNSLSKKSDENRSLNISNTNHRYESELTPSAFDESPLDLSININQKPNDKNSIQPPNMWFKSFKNRKRGQFGWFGFEPESLQWMLTPKMFLISLCLYVFVQSLVLAGYFPAVISTMERRYNFMMTEAGIIISAYDIGALLVVTFISYFGASAHRPQWIAIGAVVVGIATVLISLPEWIGPAYTNNKLHQSFKSQSLMAASSNTLLKSDTIKDDICHTNNSTLNYLNEPQVEENCQNLNSTLDFLINDKSESSKYFIIFFICNFINGIGSTPIFTLGTAFLFDKVPKTLAPMYVGVLYLTGAVGPAVGYVVCGMILKIYVDPWHSSDILPSDVNYIGAWWLGFVIFGGLIILSTIPLFGYPRSLKINPKMTKPVKEVKPPPISASSMRAKNINRTLTEIGHHDESSSLKDSDLYQREDSQVNLLTSSSNMSDNDDNQSIDTQVSMSFGNSIRDMPITIWRITKNKVFLFITLAASCEFTIITAFMTYIPKYLEAQFSIAASNAAILCGAVLVPSAGIGIVIGSYLVKRFQLSRSGCCKLACFTFILAFILFIPTFFISCDPLDIVGINVPYPNSIQSSNILNNMDKQSLKSNITTKCNENCHCSRPLKFDPVCWQERNLTFFNPCLAGCLEADDVDKDSKIPLISHKYKFKNCSCVDNSDNFGENISLTEGSCGRNCQLIPFMAALFLVTCATTMGNTPAIMITMNSVNVSERPLALGVQFLFYRALAYIPAPIYFGKLIDGACILRQPMGLCTEDEGACELYDPNHFRYIYFGMAACIKIIGFFLVLLALRASLNRDYEEELKEKTDKKVQTESNPITILSNVAPNSNRRTTSPVNNFDFVSSHQDSALGEIIEGDESF